MIQYAKTFEELSSAELEEEINLFLGKSKNHDLIVKHLVYSVHVVPKDEEEQKPGDRFDEFYTAVMIYEVI